MIIQKDFLCKTGWREDRFQALKSEGLSKNYYNCSTLTRHKAPPSGEWLNSRIRYGSRLNKIGEFLLDDGIQLVKCLKYT